MSTKEKFDLDSVMAMLMGEVVPPPIPSEEERALKYLERQRKKELGILDMVERAEKETPELFEWGKVTRKPPKLRPAHHQSNQRRREKRIKRKEDKLFKESYPELFENEGPEVITKKRGTTGSAQGPLSKDPKLAEAAEKARIARAKEPYHYNPPDQIETRPSHVKRANESAEKRMNKALKRGGSVYPGKQVLKHLTKGLKSIPFIGAGVAALTDPSEAGQMLVEDFLPGFGVLDSYPLGQGSDRFEEVQKQRKLDNEEWNMDATLETIAPDLEDNTKGILDDGTPLGGASVMGWHIFNKLKKAGQIPDGINSPKEFATWKYKELAEATGKEGIDVFRTHNRPELAQRSRPRLSTVDPYNINTDVGDVNLVSSNDIVRTDDYTTRKVKSKRDPFTVQAGINEGKQSYITPVEANTDRGSISRYDKIKYHPNRVAMIHQFGVGYPRSGKEFADDKAERQLRESKEFKDKYHNDPAFRDEYLEKQRRDKMAGKTYDYDPVMGKKAITNRQKLALALPSHGGGSTAPGKEVVESLLRQEMIRQGVGTKHTVKNVFDEMKETGKDVDTVLKERQVRHNAEKVYKREFRRQQEKARRKGEEIVFGGRIFKRKDGLPLDMPEPPSPYEYKPKGVLDIGVEDGWADDGKAVGSQIEESSISKSMKEVEAGIEADTPKSPNIETPGKTQKSPGVLTKIEDGDSVWQRLGDEAMEEHKFKKKKITPEESLAKKWAKYNPSGRLPVPKGFGTKALKMVPFLGPAALLAMGEPAEAAWALAEDFVDPFGVMATSPEAGGDADLFEFHRKRREQQNKDWNKYSILESLDEKMLNDMVR
jgi:hypothetical protein